MLCIRKHIKDNDQQKQTESTMCCYYKTITCRNVMGGKKTTHIQLEAHLSLYHFPDYLYMQYLGAYTRL